MRMIFRQRWYKIMRERKSNLRNRKIIGVIITAIIAVCMITGSMSCMSTTASANSKASYLKSYQKLVKKCSRKFTYSGSQAEMNREACAEYKLWDNDKNERFKLLRTDEKIFTGNIFTTIVDTETTCVKANQAHLDIPFGIMMDIFPIDGCPKGKFKRTMQKLNAMIYSLFLAQIVPENHGGIMALGSKFLLSIVKSPKAREKKWRNAERRMSKYKISDCEYITELCEGVHSMQPEYPKEWFASAVYREFEGLQMPIPVGYDPYLKKAFGDYMKLPPEDKQKPHHDMILVDTERSYKEVLKGKKPSELL